MFSKNISCRKEKTAEGNKQKLGILLLIEKSIASMCLEADEKRKP